MKLSDLKENDRQLDEILPALAAAGGALARGAAAVGGAALRGGAALAKGVGSAVGKGIGAVGQVAQTAGQSVGGLASGGMDPMQAAMAKKERDDQKKEIQDQIKTKQAELQDLQKKLAQLG